MNAAGALPKGAARGRSSTAAPSTTGALSALPPPVAHLSFRRKRLLSLKRFGVWAAVSVPRCARPGRLGRRSRREDPQLKPGGDMDILKSEILRKRQLVEDRNLLVVRSLGSWRGV